MIKLKIIVLFLVGQYSLSFAQNGNPYIREVEKISNEIFGNHMIKNPQKIFYSDTFSHSYFVLFEIEKDNQIMGYAVICQAKSRFDVFTFCVIYNTLPEILKVKVIDYPGVRGGEICNKKWLKQFEKKSKPEDILINKTIDGISGATISSSSITAEISKNITEMLIFLTK